jgi:hypothetical protein
MSYIGIGLDKSGKGNNWTVNSMVGAEDQMVDTPSNNFCTLNPLHLNTRMTYSEGNTKYTAIDNNSGCMASFEIPVGTKAYWEYVVLTWAGGEGDDAWIGVNIPSADLNSSVGGQSTSHSYGAFYGEKKIAGTSSSYGSAWGTGDIIGVAIDRVNHTLEFFKNGTGQGTFSISATEEHFPWFGSGGGANDANVCVNFGQDSSFAGNKTAQNNADGNGYGDFYYAPPTGFNSLCTRNLPDPTVVPGEHFNTVLYTGNQGANLSITGVGFEPSLVWGKNRSGASNHWLFDAVRGTTKMLQSDQTNSEETQTGVTAFNSDGFTLGTWIGSTKTNDSYVAWNWKANGAGVSNTAGTIASTVSANADAGFSIVKYTGNDNATSNTIGHGLSSAPELILSKRIVTGGYHWMCGYNVDGTQHSLYLNDSSARDNELTRSPQAFTSSTFRPCTISPNPHSNGVEDYIAYCFHSVDGYSKVGEYTGNGSTDGTFIHTGFRPAYLLLKETSGLNSWWAYDSSRDENNLTYHTLHPSDTGAEETSTGYGIDIVSNGIKMKNIDQRMNGSGKTYMYIAFAETPFKYSNAR